MKNIWTIILLVLSLHLTSCKKEIDQSAIEQTKLQQYNDSIFTHLMKEWKFRIPKTSKELTPVLEEWKAWNNLIAELKLRPVSTVGAFQKKATTLSELAENLPYQGYPTTLDTPDIKIRYSTLLNAMQNLDMYINLNPVNIEKVDEWLDQIQISLDDIVRMMDENLVRQNYAKEVGEDTMLEEMEEFRSETRRANPEEEQ
ncbi:hypothetical protein [Myroides fluvii]|uniref:hypothetical protein n=1 Tax=Myroides fluvii TaxID=2572594 RepID=UPI00131E4691|nr:hypothetical protein [Myroides fluvii]